jgi:hypothetical protein
VTAIKQTAKNIGCIADGAKHHLRLDRIPAEKSFRHLDERRLRREQPQPVPFHEVRRRRHVLLPQVVKGRAEQETDRVVGPSRRVDDDVLREDGLLGMKQERLLRRQVPGFTEAGRAVARAELP